MAEQLKTWLHGFDIVNFVVFDSFLKQNTCLKALKCLRILRIHGSCTVSFGKKSAMHICRRVVVQFS